MLSRGNLITALLRVVREVTSGFVGAVDHADEVARDPHARNGHAAGVLA
jgi:hypothetical protein